MRRNCHRNAGFTNLLMSGMVVVLMAIGGAVTLAVRTADRVEQTQAVLNTQQIQKKLAEYIVNNLVRDVENDGFLDLPEQWYLPNQRVPLGPDQSFDPNDEPGYLSENIIPNELSHDSQNRPFRICSYKFEGASQFHATGLTTNINEQTALAIISTSELYPQFTCRTLASTNRSIIQTKDNILFLTYGEVLNAQIRKRMAMVTSTIPECTTAQILQFTYNEQTNTGAWTCGDAILPFAANPLPANCVAGSRVSLNADNTFQCRDFSKINNIGGAAQTAIPLDRIATSLCPYGYQAANFRRVNLGDSSPLAQRQVTCNRIYGPEVGAALSMTQVYNVRRGSCSNAEFSNINNAGFHFPILYLARDGVLECLATKHDNVPTAPAVNLRTGLEGAGFVLSGNVPFVYDRGRLLPNNAGTNGWSACNVGTSLHYNFSNTSKQMSCQAQTGEGFGQYAAPNSNQPCTAGSVIMRQGGQISCVTREAFLTSIAPAQSCTGSQYISWSTATGRFFCANKR
jgi:hypothetical protein